MRVAYLGPAGTFSEEAVGHCDLLQAADRQECPSFADIHEAVLRGECDAGLLPIENSLEGSIGATLDLLVQRPGLRIRREVFLAVRQNLLALRGTSLEAIETVLSHSQPLGQCAEWLRAHLPGVPLEVTPSTAEAARQVAQRQRCAAIASRGCASRYGLDVLCEDIHDGEENVTRFVLMMHNNEKPTGHDRTSVAFSLNGDRSGGLHEVLGVFAERGINLSRIESRPNRRAMGHYVFFLDFEGHRSDRHCAEALSALFERAHTLHFLGSYPQALALHAEEDLRSANRAVP
jgi:prephenate dehydratase